jgi:hypothetical protein
MDLQQRQSLSPCEAPAVIEIFDLNNIPKGKERPSTAKSPICLYAISKWTGTLRESKILQNAALSYQRGGIQAQEAAIILNWQAVDKEKGLHTPPKFEMQARKKSSPSRRIQPNGTYVRLNTKGLTDSQHTAQFQRNSPTYPPT